MTVKSLQRILYRQVGESVALVQTFLQWRRLVAKLEMRIDGATLPSSLEALVYSENFLLRFFLYYGTRIHRPDDLKAAIADLATIRTELCRYLEKLSRTVEESGIDANELAQGFETMTEEIRSSLPGWPNGKMHGGWVIRPEVES